MFCVHCGAQVDETMRFCPQCGAAFDSLSAQARLDGAESPLNASYENPYAYGGAYDRSPNYAPESEPIRDFLLWNVLATLFCCQPCGLAGIVFSLLCGAAKGRGDLQKARRHGKTAQILFWVSVVGGILLIFVYLCLVLLGYVSKGGIVETNF